MCTRCTTPYSSTTTLYLPLRVVARGSTMWHRYGTHGAALAPTPAQRVRATPAGLPRSR